MFIVCETRYDADLRHDSCAICVNLLWFGTLELSLGCEGLFTHLCLLRIEFLGSRATRVKSLDEREHAGAISEGTLELHFIRAKVLQYLRDQMCILSEKWLFITLSKEKKDAQRIDDASVLLYEVLRRAVASSRKCVNQP